MGSRQWCCPARLRSLVKYIASACRKQMREGCAMDRRGAHMGAGPRWGMSGGATPLDLRGPWVLRLPIQAAALFCRHRGDGGEDIGKPLTALAGHSAGASTRKQDGTAHPSREHRGRIEALKSLYSPAAAKGVSKEIEVPTPASAQFNTSPSRVIRFFDRRARIRRAGTHRILRASSSAHGIGIGCACKS